MKFLHYLNFFFIFLFIIFICIIEENVVSSSLKQVQEDCFVIEEILAERDNLKNIELTVALENLEYNWNKNESKLCFLVNHKSIGEIGQEISKMKYCIISDDFELFKTGIELIKSYCKTYMHFMGASIHNLL